MNVKVTDTVASEANKGLQDIESDVIRFWGSSEIYKKVKEKSRQSPRTS